MRWEMQGNVRFGDTPEEKSRRAGAIEAARTLYSGATQFAFLARNPVLNFTDYDCSTADDLIHLTGSIIRGFLQNWETTDLKYRNPAMYFWIRRIDWAFWSPLPIPCIPPHQLELFPKEEMK